jgi:leucyl aminopeptidase
MSDVLIDTSEDAIPLHPVSEAAAAALSGECGSGGGAGEFVAGLAVAEGFQGKAGQVLKVPDALSGRLARVYVGLGEAPSAGAFRAASGRLPAGDYRIDGDLEGLDGTAIAIAWGQGTYRYDRYKPAKDGPARLVLPTGANGVEARAVAHACALARDMINTPANDLGPLQIETIAREIAHQFGAEASVATGKDLLTAGYPAVHAVGRASAPHRAPRMIEIAWGDPAHPRLAIVGKGVVFDTGGLDIKTSSGMRLMKKDMGGAAHALALGRMVMALGLPVRLAVLVPVVENAIAGDAMRPGDVIPSRKGLSIEIGNTDAEGRLILADALARAHELAPALTIDFATLTGAARAALGPQVIPFYTPDDVLAAEIDRASAAEADPLWRMPLWAGYREALDSDIADLKNDPDGWAQAGSVTAALFLERFAPDQGAWVHLDIFAWNPKARPGHPTGAEVQGVHALLRVIRDRFSRTMP